MRRVRGKVVSGQANFGRQLSFGQYRSMSHLQPAAFLLRTDQNESGMGHHPRTIIEIATDVRLRDHYQLNDGDWVEVEFT
jgi:hypothetical protein